MKHVRRSRHTATLPEGRNPVVIPKPTDRDREIFSILHPSIGHRFLPSHWIKAHFKGKSNDIIQRLGHLREHGYIKWSDDPLNVEYDVIRHGIYELAPKGAAVLGLDLPPFPKNEHPHELLGSLRACSLKFQARAAHVPFAFFPPATYKLPSGATWKPDEKPILLGEKPRRTLLHFEDERRANNITNGEKIEKAYEYIKQGLYKNDAETGLVLFLSTTQAHTDALKTYVEKNYGRCSFLGFATTDDWAYRKRPSPLVPLVSEWERVGHPPLKLFEGGAL